MDVRISFVVPALNEEQLIAQTLNSIHGAMHRSAKQTGYEVIVADDRSSDSTVALARRNQAHVVEVCKRNIAAVRNAGAAGARGEFLIFVDADTQVNQSLIEEAIQAMIEGATWGTSLATTWDECPLWGRVGLTLFNRYYVRSRECAYGFFFFVDRQAFQQVGGFPEDTREGEDMALSRLLRREYGPPTVLRSRVATSARKTRQFGLWYHIRMLCLMICHGDDAYTRPEIADYRDGELRARRPE